MPPKKSKMPAFEMSAEQALFKERFADLVQNEGFIKRRRLAKEDKKGEKKSPDWIAVCNEYFSKNPESKINRANFDRLIDDLEFTIHDINIIASSTKSSNHLLPVIENLIANIDILKELKEEAGLDVQHISLIIKDSCGSSGNKIQILKANIDVLKALTAKASEDTNILDEEGLPIKGLNFESKNISNIFLRSADQVGAMTPARLIAIKRLLGPEFKFTHSNISSIFGSAGASIGDAIDKITSPRIIEGFKRLLSLEFGPSCTGIAGMLNGSGIHVVDAVENLFKIVNYQSVYQDKSALKLAVKLIGINKDPIAVLNCLHDNFANPLDVLEAIVVSKKYNREKLSDYAPESLEEFLAEIAKNPDLLRRFEASDISSNEDERENSDISSGDEGEAEELAMSDKMAPRGKRKGRFGYDIDILINTGEGANMSEFSVLEDQTIGSLKYLSELEKIELGYLVEPMPQFQIGEAAPLASKGKGKEISK